MAHFRHISSGSQGDSGLERRRHVRYAGDGLLVMIDGRLHPAADISLGGVRVTSAPAHDCGEVIPLRVIPVVDEVMLLDEGVAAEAQVLGAGRDGLRMVFLRQHAAMAKLLSGHARRQRMNVPFA